MKVPLLCSGYLGGGLWMVGGWWWDGGRNWGSNIVYARGCVLFGYCAVNFTSSYKHAHAAREQH